MHAAGKQGTSITDAGTFARDFFHLADSRPPPNGKAWRATSWFENLMLELAALHGLYCQNKRSRRRGEWMNVDHVFIPMSNTYADFPLVAIEHENGDLSTVSKSGAIPDGDSRRAFIEWAAWKTLTMRARLHVLVAYPWMKDKSSALDVLARMVDGYLAAFGDFPNALFLLGWWGVVPRLEWKAERLYVPYVPVRRRGIVTLRTLADAAMSRH